MSVYVIVDDDDAGISWWPHANQTAGSPGIEADGWVVASPGNSTEFRATVSGSGIPSTMSYSFNGSSISLYGTIGGGDGFSSTNVSFSVDFNIISTSVITSSSDTRRHIPFFVSPSMPDSSHTLTVDVLTSASTLTDSNFFIDYLIYEASENSTVSTTEDTSWIFIDDHSPYLNYSDGWTRNVLGFPQQGNFNLTDATFNSSVMGPTSSSSNVSLKFTGASTIRAYGMILNSVSTLGTYAIDGVSANMSAPTTFPAYNYELFTANPTTGESHTLEITAADANAFYLDYVLMKSDSAFISSPSLTGNGGNGGGNNHEKADNSRHLGVGAIVGISIGGLVFLSFLLVSFFVLRRRRSEAENSSDGHPPVDIDAEVTYAAFTQSPAGMDRMLTEAYHLRRSESDYNTTAAPGSGNQSLPTFLPSESRASSSHDPGYVPLRSQSEKLAAYTHATSSSNNSDGANLAIGGTSAQALDGGSVRSAPQQLVVDSDSGLRGLVHNGAVEHLPPQYSAE